MAVVLDKADVDTFIRLSNEENLEATPVAVVTDENRLEMTWRGDKIVDLSRDFLNTNGVTQHAKVEISAVDENKNYRKKCLLLLIIFHLQTHSRQTFHVLKFAVKRVLLSDLTHQSVLQPFLCLMQANISSLLRKQW